MAKERLLGDCGAEAVPVVVPSRGRKLVGGLVRSELTRAGVESVLTRGFFPRVEASARPEPRTRAALTQLGLPYAHDAGITRHLAACPGRQLSATEDAEEGTECEPAEQELGLVVGEPVAFRFFGSSVRRDDEVGTVLERWDEGELEELPEIQAMLSAEGRTPGEVVPVRLRAGDNEVGVLKLEAIPRTGDERWKVELDVRAGEAA